MPSDLSNISHVTETVYDGESAHWRHVKCFRELTRSKNTWCCLCGSTCLLLESRF